MAWLSLHNGKSKLAAEAEDAVNVTARTISAESGYRTSCHSNARAAAPQGLRLWLREGTPLATAR